MDERRWARIGVVVFGAAAFLLVSMGGAIVAAPVTVPLMVAAVRRHPTPAFRTAGAALVALTGAEVAWALTYVTAGEVRPWIWLLPALAALAGALATVRPRAALASLVP
jgi:hypothetical protein